MSLPYRASDIAELRELLDESIQAEITADDPMLTLRVLRLKELIGKLIDMLEDPGRIRP